MRTLDERLAAAETARQDLERQHAAELTAAATRHAAELAAAATQLAELQARHDAAAVEHAGVRAALEQEVTETAGGRQRAEAALADAAGREADLVERLAGESDARAELERTLAAVRAEAGRSRRRLLQVSSAYRRRAREQRARLEAQLTDQQAAAGREREERDDVIRQVQLESELLQRQLGATERQLEDLRRVADDEREIRERALSASESELRRVSAEYGHLRESFDRLQGAFRTLEGIAGEHAAERSRLEGVVAERDSELSAQAERHGLARQRAQDAFGQLEETLRQTLAAGASEQARLQQEIDALRGELDGVRAHADLLRGDAERVPELETQLALSQRERRREFERAPYGLCRCTQGGVITHANHSFVAMLGYRRADDLRNLDFATAVLDSAGDLGWLLERTRNVRRTEAVDTNWKTLEGRDLVVRLQALTTASGAVEIVAEDITGVRALEERLRQAQRMEAVGRLASEVAVTCDSLLADVTRGVQEWLRTSGDEGLRRQGERVLTDLTRTAGYLRQLGVYGEQEVRALEPVSVQRVLRDLAPVLRRVVGDQIALVLSKSSGSFDIDVDAERLERVLVNVASYARQRMPRGGQMRIDLGTIALGRRFVDRYPNVRPGHHVLITVTEVPGDDFRGAGGRAPAPADKPGVDLGTLVELLGTCGGHLWMEAQPAGNMVLKMYLPRRSGDAADAKTPRAERGGRLARWFRGTPASGARA